jgi:VWFA-related protein
MQSIPRRPTLAAGLLLAALLLSSAGPAQEPGQAPLHSFFAPVEVPLVSIDVYVADRQGRPVPGLAAADFEILEDGEPVAISHFYAAPGVEPPPSEDVAAPEAPGETVDAPPQDLYLVIYIDDINLGRSRRQSALEHVQRFFAAELPEGMQVMIVRYDGRVRVEQAFSSELEEVRAALDRAASAASLSRDLDENRMLREMDNARQSAATAGTRAQDFAETAADSLLREIDVYAEQTVQRTRAGIADQIRFVRSLSGVGGRKAVLVISDGVEARVGERLYRAWAEAFGTVPGLELEAQRAFLRAARNDVSDEYEELARVANAHRVSLYTLSRVGEGVAAASSAERRFMDTQGLIVDQTLSADVLMASTAGTTGGRVLTNSPGLAGQLDEVAEELASYYSLAFEPSHAGDGGYHTIEVKVRREGVRVRHREGYLDVPPDDRLADRTLAAAVHGIGANPLGISLERGESVARGDGSLLVPVIITVPIGELVLVPAEEEHQGRITILLVVRGADGGLSPVQERRVPVPVANLDLPTALGQNAGFTLRLAMRPGPQRIAVGVRDDVGRAESVTTLDVEVGPAGE